MLGVGRYGSTGFLWLSEIKLYQLTQCSKYSIFTETPQNKIKNPHTVDLINTQDSYKTLLLTSPG